MSHGYATVNALTGLAAGSFTWSSGQTAGRDKLNDGVQDELALGSASAQASGQTLSVDLGSAVSLVGIALLGHNLSVGSCTVQVLADSVNTFATAVTAKATTTIPTTAPNDRDAVLQFPAVSRRYWRLVFGHSGTKTVSFGEILFLTTITTLTRSRAYGHGESERYVTNQNESSTGSVRATLLSGPIRTKRFSFRDMRGTAERDELMAMFRASRGGVTPLLWIDTIESVSTAATAAGQECLWSQMSESHGWTENDFSLYDVDGFELRGMSREVL
ncbi:MAG: hypothetical protein JNM17_04140 [Archangium sp.]|nr:hypothetical protein [Archangium sp.]